MTAVQKDHFGVAATTTIIITNSTITTETLVQLHLLSTALTTKCHVVHLASAGEPVPVS